MNLFWFCCFFRQLRRSPKNKNGLDSEPPIEYPWSVKENLDPKNYILENKSSGVFGRAPGEIDGQQFVIRNCNDICIYLFDHINSVMIDDCSKCTIVTGPVRASVFIRDCKSCTILTACQQFRTRDCENITTFLSCVTEPIIESSLRMFFGPYQCFYPELEEQFAAAGLSIFNCNWSEIYDFTPDQDGEPNAKFLGPNDLVTNYIPTPQEALANQMKVTSTDPGVKDENVALVPAFSTVAVSFDRRDSLVPYTVRNRPGPWEDGDQRRIESLVGQVALIVIFNHPEAVSWAKTILSQLRQYESCHVIRTRYAKFSEYEMERIFGVPVKSKLAKVGAVIYMEVNGPNHLVGPVCDEVVMKMHALHPNPEVSSFVRVISDSTMARKQMEQLDGQHRVHMNAF